MSTPLQYFNYQNGILSSKNVSLLNVIKKTGTPVYVYSSEGFLKPLEELKSGLKGLEHLICFAMKANSNIAILKLLSEAGAGMDLVSGGELYRARLAGIPASKIVFSGVGKTTDEISNALLYDGKGIFSFNIESAPELELLNSIALEMKKKARIALRFNPDVDAKTHPYISTGLKKNKFGMNRNEILRIVNRLDNFPSIELSGISIHIGSQLLSLSPLRDAFIKLRTLTEEINSKINTPLSFLDLGGGIGITYKNERTPKIKKYCDLIHQYFGKKSGLTYSPKILLEPGRAISGNSGVLITKVLYRKERADKDFLIVDAAMNDLMRPALYGSYHDIVPVEKRKHLGKRKKTNLVGPICETSDCFAVDRPLPASLSKGDTVAILSSGAYGFTMASNYNSRPRPSEVLIQNGRFRVIRKRETLEDLIRGEDLN